MEGPDDVPDDSKCLHKIRIFPTNIYKKKVNNLKEGIIFPIKKKRYSTSRLGGFNNLILRLGGFYKTY